MPTSKKRLTKNRSTLRTAFVITGFISLFGCNITTNSQTQPSSNPPETSAQFDAQLITLIESNNMDSSVARGLNLPDITNPLAQLGKKLFYSKSLGGNLDVSCATCHHPALGGADALSVSIGVNAVAADNLGLARLADSNNFNIGRNAPTVFNTGLWRQGLFWDSRVEFLSDDTISTPDSGYNVTDVSAGVTLAAAQARFPVTSETEMLGTVFSSGESTMDIRNHLSERLDSVNVGLTAFETNEWLNEFQQAFGQNEPASTLITFDNIAHAIGEFERSMVFIDSPWQRFIAGDSAAMTDRQKQGAILFLTAAADEGAGCIACHRGPTFTDESFNLAAFPQLGPLTDNVNGDIGREAVTGDLGDRYRFRTPSLLNVELTAPYGHAGTYQTLLEVVQHYNNPAESVSDFFNNDKLCDLPQFSQLNNCEDLYPNASDISGAAIRINNTRNPSTGNGKRLPTIQLSNDQKSVIVEFLESLTDDCANDIICIEPWIADEILDNPDGNVLL